MPTLLITHRTQRQTRPTHYLQSMDKEDLDCCLRRLFCFIFQIGAKYTLRPTPTPIRTLHVDKYTHASIYAVLPKLLERFKAFYRRNYYDDSWDVKLKLSTKHETRNLESNRYRSTYLSVYKKGHLWRIYELYTVNPCTAQAKTYLSKAVGFVRHKNGQVKRVKRYTY